MHKTFTTSLHSVWLRGLPIYVWPFIISPSVTSRCALLWALRHSIPAPGSDWHQEPEATWPWFPTAAHWLASDGPVSFTIVTGSLLTANWDNLRASHPFPHLTLVLKCILCNNAVIDLKYCHGFTVFHRKSGSFSCCMFITSSLTGHF